jgi:hypothetical protein
MTASVGTRIAGGMAHKSLGDSGFGVARTLTDQLAAVQKYLATPSTRAAASQRDHLPARAFLRSPPNRHVAASPENSIASAGSARRDIGDRRSGHLRRMHAGQRFAARLTSTGVIA